jgi:hypothetical protein
MKRQTSNGLWASALWLVAGVISWVTYCAPSGSLIELFSGFSAVCLTCGAGMLFVMWIEGR